MLEPSTAVALAELLERLAALLRESAAHQPQPAVAPAAAEPTWVERLWAAPDQVRFGVPELCQALGVRRSWVYRHTCRGSRLPPIPHRKLDGIVLFTAGEVRDWVRQNSVTIVPGRSAVIVGARRSKG